MKVWLSIVPVQHIKLGLIRSKGESASKFYKTARKQEKCLLSLQSNRLGSGNKKLRRVVSCLTASATQKEIRVPWEYTIWWGSDFLPDEIAVFVLYLVEGCEIPALGNRAQAQGVWWISHGAGRLCLAAGLSEWHSAQEGASLCNVPPLPAGTKQNQVTNACWTRGYFHPSGWREKSKSVRPYLLKEHDLILHWGPAALPWGKPRNRKTAVISLCQNKLGYCHWSCSGREHRTWGEYKQNANYILSPPEALVMPCNWNWASLPLSFFSRVVEGKCGLWLYSVAFCEQCASALTVEA